MAEDVKASKAEAKQPKKILVQPVFGRMVNVLNNQALVGVTEIKEIDAWVQAQIDAGKLQLA
jgi:hypothetical protein